MHMIIDMAETQRMTENIVETNLSDGWYITLWINCQRIAKISSGGEKREVISSTISDVGSRSE